MAPKINHWVCKYFMPRWVLARLKLTFLFMYVIFRGKVKLERAAPSMTSFTTKKKTCNQYEQSNPLVLLTGSRISRSLFVRQLRVAMHLKTTTHFNSYEYTNRPFAGFTHMSLFYAMLGRKPIEEYFVT